MTFLFTDVVRSTALLTNLDRGRFADLLETQRRIVGDAVVATRGVVVDQTGDAVLGAFGSAGDALAAAVSVQRTLATADTGEFLSVRMGIDSGDVLLRGAAYVGSAVHRGARICALAGRGSVLLSAISRELVRSHSPDGVEMRDLGEVLLAGFVEPVQLFQAVLADVPASAERPSIPRRSAQLFDRERELAVMDERIRGALGRAGGVVVIEGAAGIGKTSLLESARASAAGMTSLGARSTDSSQAIPSVSFASSSSLLYRRRPSRRWPARPAAHCRSSTARARARSATDSRSCTRSTGSSANLSEQKPLLLSVDDVQWCDAPSLRYLAYLASRIGDLPIVLLLARRSGEPSVAEEALEVIVSDPQTTVVRPGGLSVDAVAALLRRVLAQPPDPAFVAACRAATGSNPLLVRELAGALAAASVPPTADAVASIPDLGPAAVSRFVLRRLGRLSASARALAESVAVLGDGCALTTATEHAGLEHAAAADAAGSLARADLLAAGTPLSFVHPLVRAAVYQQLGASDLAAAHARAAAILQSDGDPIRIGLHALQATPGGVDEAAAALQAAARAAEIDGDPEAAARFLVRALDEPLGASDRIAALISLGSAELRFDPQRAAVHLRQALDSEAEPEVATHAALLLGRALYMEGAHTEAVAVLEAALTGSVDGDRDLAYRLEAELIGPLSELREEARVAELLARADGRELRGEGLGRRMLVGQIAASLALPLNRQEYVLLAQEALRDDLLLEDETSDIYVWATAALSAADELTAARDALDRAVTHAQRRGSVHLLATALRFRAHTEHLLGDLPSAEVDVRAGLAALELHPHPTTQRYLAAALANVLIERGLYDEATSLLDALPPLVEGPEAGVVVYARSELALATGKPANALLLLDEFTGSSSESSVAAPRRGRGWLLLRARALAALGRLGEASALAEAELERERDWGAPRTLALALRVVALASQPERQLTLLTEAHAVIEESPAQLERAHVLAALGAATRRAGKRVEARKLLREGLELAHLCSAAALEREIRDELIAAGGRPRRVRLSGVDALTPSEARIAQRAASGRTNREIAQELFVTLKTVEMHLASCYRKLDISSRSQLGEMLAPKHQG